MSAERAPRRLSKRLLQNEVLVGEFDAALKKNVSEVRDYTARFHRRMERRGIATMRGTGWAVRPFLLPAAQLDFVASSLHAGLTELKNVLRAWLARPGALTRALPFHPDFERCVDVVDGVWSAAFLSHLRPDGFFFEDRYVLSEINYGNGLIVSCGYTEAVHEYWSGHPVLKRLGWDVARLHRRPFPFLVSVLKRFVRPAKRPTVALVAHSAEWKVLESYPKRVLDQVRFARDELVRSGLGARLVTEEGLEVGRDGNPRFRSDGRAVDLVMFITVSSSFLDEPRLMLPGGPLAPFGTARIGDVWVLKPLAGLVVDKAALTVLGTLRERFPAASHDGYRVEVAPTEFPYRKAPERYTRAKDEWVIKRGFDGKDTHIGIARSPEAWRSVVREVVKDKEYVAQRYVSLPRCEIPVFVDEKHLEWVPSRVELSSFLFDGLFGGAAGRHAPDAEGLVMSDAPPDYGFSTVFSV